MQVYVYIRGDIGEDRIKKERVMFCESKKLEVIQREEMVHILNVYKYMVGKE